MRILALNPYHGGSHKALIDGWRSRSRHEFETLTLPAHHWKWRMRHAGITFARHAGALHNEGERFDAVFCTDMMNLAEFRGLAPREIAALPSVAYFHENQLTYPDATASERDHHFAMTNFVTALAADAVWFNSDYHRAELLDAMREFLGRMPDHSPYTLLGTIAERSSIQPPGVECGRPRGERPPGPLRILWAARWEHDKGPDRFFAALNRLVERGVDFRVSVLGESFAAIPDCFGDARYRLADRIDHWGYIDNRSAFRNVLRQADVVVSTALHEFFGISVVEATAQGCVPVVPDRLAYPEVLDPDVAVFYGSRETDADLRDESVAGDIDETEALTIRLNALATRAEDAAWWSKKSAAAIRSVERFDWTRRVDEMDDALEQLK